MLIPEIQFSGATILEMLIRIEDSLNRDSIYSPFLASAIDSTKVDSTVDSVDRERDAVPSPLLVPGTNESNI